MHSHAFPFSELRIFHIVKFTGSVPAGCNGLFRRNAELRAVRLFFCNRLTKITLFDVIKSGQHAIYQIELLHEINKRKRDYRSAKVGFVPVRRYTLKKSAI